MDSFKDIIDAYSVSVLSGAFGVPESHVRTMRARNSIPSTYWPILVEKAPSELQGVVTFDFLCGLRNRRFREPKITQAEGAPAQ